MPKPARGQVLLVLLGGIVAVSTASIFIRFAQQGAPSLAIAAGRLLFASVALAPFALVGHRTALGALSGRDLALGLLSGLFLALHFALWITSLEHTTVASSVVLVTTTPLWVALLAPWLLREPLARNTWLGILLALAGGIVVGLSDAPAGPGPRGHALRGDLLALAGAWMMAGYLLVGRRLRGRLRLVPYVFLVYGMAALVLLAWLVAAGQSLLGLPAATYLWLVLLALVPQILGHSSFNWALRWLPAAFVAIALLGEPVGTTALACVVLHEVPTPLKLAGAGLILVGILVATLGRGGDPLPAEPEP